MIKKMFLFSNKFKQIKRINFALFIFVVLIGLSFTNSVFGWTAPTVTAPGGNRPSPLNTSATQQVKEGNLIVVGNTIITGNINLNRLGGNNEGDIIGANRVSGYDDLILRGADYGLNPADEEEIIWIDDGTGAGSGKIVLKTNKLERMRIDVNGNVGIGTASPGYTLDVAGNINLTGNLTVAGVPFATGYWTATSTSIYYNTGNVGIGTDNPGYKLEVAGTGRFGDDVLISSTSPFLDFKDTDHAWDSTSLGTRIDGHGSANGFAWRLGRVSGTDDFHIMTASGSNILFEPATGLVATIGSSGLTMATSKNITLTGGTFVAYSSEIGQTDRRLTINVNDADLTSIYNYDQGGATFHPISFGGGGGTGVVVLGDGTVGMGTISPDTSYKLTVTGGGIKSESTSNPAGYFNSSSGYGLLVNTGNVGIGTITPAYKLEVVGNTNIQGNLTVTGTLSGSGLWTATSTSDIYYKPGAGNGYVGIGTDSPTVELEIGQVGDLDTSRSIRLQTTNGAYYADITVNHNSANAFNISHHGYNILQSSGDAYAQITYGASGTQKHKFDNGIVEIDGSATIGGNLTVSGGLITLHTAGAGVIVNDDNNQYNIFSGGNASDDGANLVVYGSAHATNPNKFRFRVGGSEKASLDSSGNLQIVGGLTVKGDVIYGASTDTNLQIRSNNHINFFLDDNANGSAQFNIYNGGDTNVFNVNESGDVQMDGNLTVDGSITAASIVLDGINGTYIDEYQRGYLVNDVTTLPLLDINGNSFGTTGDNEVYVEAYTAGTGTASAAIAIFSAANDGAWSLKNIYEYATSSNHPQFLLNGGVPSIRTYHASLYTVAVKHKVTNNSSYFWAREAYIPLDNRAETITASWNFTDSVGIGTTSPGYKLSVSDGTDQLGLYHDGTNAYFKTTDGAFYFKTDEGTNTDTWVKIQAKGVGAALVSGLQLISAGGNSFQFKITDGGQDIHASWGDIDITSGSSKYVNLNNVLYAEIDGGVGVGTASPGAKLNVVYSASTSFMDRGILSESYGTPAHWKGLIVASADGTEASPTGLAVGEQIGGMNFVGYDGATWRIPALMTAEISSVSSGVSMGAELQFWTGTVTGDAVAGAYTGLTQRMTIDKDGDVNLTGNLTVGGSIENWTTLGGTQGGDPYPINWYKVYELTGTGRGHEDIEVLFSGDTNYYDADCTLRIQIYRYTGEAAGKLHVAVTPVSGWLSNGQVKVNGGEVWVSSVRKWGTIKARLVQSFYNPGRTLFNTTPVTVEPSGTRIDGTFGALAYSSDDGLVYYHDMKAGAGYFAGPEAKLQVDEYTVGVNGNQVTYGVASIFADSGADALYLGIKNAAYPNRGWSFRSTTSGVNSNLTIHEHGSSGARMTILSGGNVGIGTTSPSALLEISKAGVDYKALVIGDGGDDTFYIDANFAGAGQTGNWLELNDTWGNNLMTWKDAKVGIGTTSPDNALQIVKTTGAVWQYNDFPAGTIALELGESGTTKVGAIKMWGYTAGEYVFMRPSNGNFHIDSTEGNYYFNWDDAITGAEGTIRIGNISGSETVKITTSGDSYFNGGNIGIGDSTPTYKLDVSGSARVTSGLYYGEWLRSLGSGLYWEPGTTGAGWHIYPKNTTDMYMRTAGSNGGICGTIGSTTPRGYIHWTTSNEIGFLTSARGWALRTDSSANTFITGDLTVTGNDITTPGSMTLHTGGYIDIRPTSTGYGVVLREYDTTATYLGLTQHNGYSYFTDSATYGSYFLRGGGADIHVRGGISMGAQTRYYSFGSTDFNPQNNLHDIYYGSGYEYFENNSLGSKYVHAGIHLPQGATVTACQVWGQDTSNNWWLTRGDVNSESGWGMASGAINSADTTVGYSVIDNSNYYYIVRIYLGVGDKVYGGRVTYTVTNPYP